MGRWASCSRRRSPASAGTPLPTTSRCSTPRRSRGPRGRRTTCSTTRPSHSRHNHRESGNKPLVGGESGTAVSGTGTGAKTLAAMVLEAGERYDGVAMRYNDNDRWVESSYDDVVTAAREIAGGLIEQGVEPGDRVAIFSDTRPEWTLADLG